MQATRPCPTCIETEGEQMEKEMKQQEKTKEIRSNVNEREMATEWLALKG